MPGRIRAAALLITGVLIAAPAGAQVVQSVQFGVGGFFPRGLDSRAADDVLARDYFGASLPGAPNLSDALVFNVSDFRMGSLFGEWTVGFGDHVEVGANVAFQKRTVPTVYADLVDQSGGDVAQTLRLRMIPTMGIVRFLPFGRPGDVQPYVGAGAGVVNFRYSEFGDFIDPQTLEIYSQTYTKTGTAGAGLLLGGVRFPLGGDIYALSLEGRYLWSVGSGLGDNFLADKIDMSGGGFNVGFQVRF
jgi:hypothetical protein